MTFRTRAFSALAVLLLAAILTSCTGMMACSLRGTCGTSDGGVPDAGTTKSITAETDRYSVDAEYPVTADADVTRRIAELVYAEINSFKAQSEDGAPPPRPNTLMMRFEVQEAPDDVFSVVFHSYIYTGGAHGMTHVITRNYEVPGGRLVTLDDLFGRNADYLPVLSEIVQSELRNKLGESADSGWIGRGVAPNAENFQRFTLTRSPVIFHFEHYQVAPYSAGIQTVEVPRTEIANLLRS